MLCYRAYIYIDMSLYYDSYFFFGSRQIFTFLADDAGGFLSY